MINKQLLILILWMEPYGGSFDGPIIARVTGLMWMITWLVLEHFHLLIQQKVILDTMMRMMIHLDLIQKARNLGP